MGVGWIAGDAGVKGNPRLERGDLFKCIWEICEIKTLKTLSWSAGFFWGGKQGAPQGFGKLDPRFSKLLTIGNAVVPQAPNKVPNGFKGG